MFVFSSSPRQHFDRSLKWIFIEFELKDIESSSLITCSPNTLDIFYSRWELNRRKQYFHKRFSRSFFVDEHNERVDMEIDEENSALILNSFSVSRSDGLSDGIVSLSRCRHSPHNFTACWLLALLFVLKASSLNIIAAHLTWQILCENLSQRSMEIYVNF